MRHALARRLIRPALAALAGGMLLTGAPALAAGAPAQAAKPKGTLGPFGYRGVKLGMTAAQARATGKIRREASQGQCSAWDYRTRQTSRNGPDVLVSRRYGVAAILVDQRVRTPRGIGIGSTRKQLRRAYPDVRRAESGFLYAPAPRNREAHYVFVLSDRRITQLGLILNEQDCAN
ncbi:hypothetical protein GCM10010466_65720 [Planomonospora alba]|uniref:Uncharacterized protein n=1 Tax=Planomonospora alba TaxID=161354 RepID=A0ABP6P2P8_9ACTN